MNTPTQDWEALRHGQAEALEAVFKAYFQDLLQYGYHLLPGQAQQVEDHIQQLFLRLWEKRDKLPVVQQVKAYLFRSLRNSIIDAGRKQRPTTAVSEAETADFAPSQEALLIAREHATAKQQQLQQALAQLSVRQREIIHLRFYQGVPYPEIAEILDMRYQSVRNTVYRALTQLRGKMGR